MPNYTSEEKIERMLGITITDSTVPSIETLTEMMSDADGMINAEARSASNMEDTYGELDPIAKNLVLKMIRRLWSFRNPDVFPYEEVILTPEEMRIIHRVHDKFSGKTYDAYESGNQ